MNLNKINNNSIKWNFDFYKWNKKIANNQIN